jgi:S-DNA-T family DNA segregation ATPase FtsK/SpoIIIE
MAQSAASAMDPALDGDTDSALLVAAITQAHLSSNDPVPRRPWPDPLEPDIPLSVLQGIQDSTVFFARADDPGNQRQQPAGWKLANSNLLLIGLGGSGTTSTLAAIALTLAKNWSPSELRMYVLDAGAGDLAALRSLPHVHGVVRGNERRKQTKFVRLLQSELHSRRRLREQSITPIPCVVLIDNYTAWYQELDNGPGRDLIDQFVQVYKDGPEVGMHFAVSTDRIAVGSQTLANTTHQKWMFRVADPNDYHLVNQSPKNAPPAVPGRAIISTSGLHAQVGSWPRPLTAEVARIAESYGLPPGKDAFEELPDELLLSEFDAVAVFEERSWIVPVGVLEEGLEPAYLVLHEGDHAVISGRPHSGVSTTLATIATVLRRGAHAAGRPLFIAVTGPGLSKLSSCPEIDQFMPDSEISTLVADLRSRIGPAVLLIDGPVGLPDEDRALENLLRSSRGDFHIIVGGRTPTLNGIYTSWFKQVREGHTGILFSDDPASEQNVFDLSNVRAQAGLAFPAGRGYIINNGVVSLAQVATAKLW